MIVRCRLIAAVLCIVVQVSQAMDLATMVEILRQRTLNNNVNNQTQGPTIQPSDVNQLSEYLLPGGDLEDMIDPEDVPVQVRLVIPPGDLGFSSNELRFGLSVRKSASSRSSEWGEFSCCRQGLNLQSRERMVSDRVMELDKRQCSDNYCESCFDDRPTCRLFKTQIRACHPSSSYRPFMSRHCPETCDMCSATTTTAETTTVNTEETTTEATADPNLVRVNIHYNDVTAPHLYMYSASQSRPRSPWKPVSRSSYVGEVTSFQIYSRRTGAYNTPFYFCKARHGSTYKWMIRKAPCASGWSLDLKLYASSTRQPNSQRLFIANRGRGPWTSRISQLTPCCGYTSAVWTIYVPRSSSEPSTSAPTTTTTAEPTATSRADQPRTAYERECLTYHNFYRAIHNLPSFTWDTSLAVTAQRWADHLVESAPNHPFMTKRNVQRTPHWPHSVSGTRNRDRGVGENIAWDFSVDGSPAKESVLRWYAEVFDYNRENPTLTTQGVPVGHYTQMLWRSTRSVGCAVAVRLVRRGGRTYKTTYAVSHYNPGGNFKYTTNARTIRSYLENVPDPRESTCMSPAACSGGDRCMGFDSEVTCGCQPYRYRGNTRRQPVCQGSGGCMVRCKKQTGRFPGIWRGECQGESSCKCSLIPVNNVIGAICV
nr:uncharacterized protein LOC100182344 [Ciona intestinalis]|eukprot:XP_009860608.2 uncharacterized protein LOC100182344 [Ciona intestinalis]